MDDTITTYVPCIAIDENNVVWTGRGKWLCGWDDNKKSWEYHAIKDSIAGIDIDSKGRFWLATQSLTVVLFNKTTKTKKQIPLKDLKKDARVNNVILDETQTFWVCTSGGLIKVRESYGDLKAEIIHDFMGQNVKDVVFHKGITKLITDNGVYQNKNNTWEPILSYDKKKIWAIDVNGGDELFISYNHAKPDYVLKDVVKIGTDSTRHFRFNQMLADDYGRCWGAVKGGVYAWADAVGFWHYFNDTNSELKITEAWVISQDRKGGIWVGATEGLYKIIEPPLKTAAGLTPMPNSGTPANSEASASYNENAVLPAGTADIHLVLVLDISGSMESSITRMGVAFNNILKNLRAEDHISIVSYASKVQVEAENLSVNTDSKKQIRETFETFKYKGGTNIKSALSKANAIAKKNKVVGGNNRVIIVSDANFDVKARFPMVADMAANGIKVSIFCSQKKTPDQHKDLEKFAKMGGGTYFNFAVGNAKTLEQAFWEELSQ